MNVLQSVTLVVNVWLVSKVCLVTRIRAVITPPALYHYLSELPVSRVSTCVSMIIVKMALVNPPSRYVLWAQQMDWSAPNEGHAPTPVLKEI